VQFLLHNNQNPFPLPSKANLRNSQPWPITIFILFVRRRPPLETIKIASAQPSTIASHVFFRYYFLLWTSPPSPQTTSQLSFYFWLLGLPPSHPPASVRSARPGFSIPTSQQKSLVGSPLDSQAECLCCPLRIMLIDSALAISFLPKEKSLSFPKCASGRTPSLLRPDPRPT